MTWRSYEPKPVSKHVKIVLALIIGVALLGASIAQAQDATPTPVKTNTHGDYSIQTGEVEGTPGPGEVTEANTPATHISSAPRCENVAIDFSWVINQDIPRGSNFTNSPSGCPLGENDDHLVLSFTAFCGDLSVHVLARGEVEPAVLSLDVFGCVPGPSLGHTQHPVAQDNNDLSCDGLTFDWEIWAADDTDVSHLSVQDDVSCGSASAMMA